MTGDEPLAVEIDIAEVMGIASWLGVDLDAEEAALYRAALVEQLQRFDAFMYEHQPEDRPPQYGSGKRDAGHRPSAEEDPLRAWVWLCDIDGADDGVLTHKSVSFKDHISVAGIPQGFASHVMDGFIPDVDATVVTRVLAAGGRVIGKNSMSGFMNDRPPALNPHDASRVTGGSSFGSAAAVAAAEVDISFGGDQGGSIRVPAAYCGVVGLKPTFGLVSHYGATFGAEQSLDHIGPLGRRVDDVAAALQAVAGFDPYDPRQTRMIPDHLDALSQIGDGVKGLRIGLLEEGFAEPADPDVSNGVLEAVELLAKAGATISKVSIPQHQRINAVYAALAFEGAKSVLDTGFYGSGSKTYYPADAIAALHDLWHRHANGFPPRTKLNHMIATVSRRRHHGAVYAKAQNLRPMFTRAYDLALARVDVLAMPTVRTVAPPIKKPPTDRLRAIEANLRRNWIVMPHTYNTKPANYTGHPALAIPCGKVGGLPISLQLVGRHFDDPLLLRAAYAYQQSVDWDQLIRIGPAVAADGRR